jgi:hypothetical protein
MPAFAAYRRNALRMPDGSSRVPRAETKRRPLSWPFVKRGRVSER